MDKLRIFSTLSIASIFVSVVWICNPNDFEVNLMCSPLLALWGSVLGYGLVDKEKK